MRVSRLRGAGVVPWISYALLPLLQMLAAGRLSGQTAPPAKPASPATPAAAAPNAFVGSNVCKTCHADVWQNFFRNAHYRSIASGKETPEKTGCESCHGAGQEHVKAAGGRTTIPRAFSLLEPAQAIDACLACHTKDVNRGEIRRSAHTQTGIACNNCHSIHRPATPRALLAKTQVNLCTGCHLNVRAQFAMPTRHRVNEGFMQCTDCHNPHGTGSPSWRMGVRPRMVERGRDGEQPCLRCHADKRGPFAFEHAATRVDGCETCHSPHGSMNPRMLRRPAVFTLCLECHSGAGAFGRQGDGISLQSGSHNMADPRYQNCTACHARIHGSNSDQRFLR